MKNIVVCLTAVLLSVTVNAESTADKLFEMGITHERLEVFENDGVISGYIGVMRGADCTDKAEETFCRDASIEKAIEAAWDVHGVSKEHRTELRVTKALQVDDYFYIVKMSQTINGIPVYGASLAIATNPDGDIELVVGSLLPYTAKSAPTEHDGLQEAVSQVQKELSSIPLLSTEHSTSFLGENGHSRVALVNNGSMEQSVDPTTGKPVYLYRGGSSGTGLMVVKDGVIVDKSTGEMSSNKPAYLPVRYMPNSWEWRTSTRIYDWEYVGYNYGYYSSQWQCQYQARYDHSSPGRDVDRITDLANVTAYKNASCNVTPYVHTGSSFGHSDYREWDLLWRLKQHQAFMSSYVYNVVGGGTPESLSAEVGAPTDACSQEPLTPACYQSWRNTIVLEGTASNTDPAAYDAALIGHEYGHHAHHTYGLGDIISCSNTNHRAVITQWMATGIGSMLALKSHRGVTPNYHLGASTIHAHLGGYTPSSATSSCTQEYGPLTEPLWEIAHDVNCGSTYCIDPDVDTADDIGYSDSYLQTMIIRSLVWAALLAPSSGSNYTIQTAAAVARTYMYTQLNSTGDAQVTSIMGHHGL